MKYLFSLFSICLFVCFSSVSGVFAQEGYLDQLLQLSTGLESYQMETIPALPNKTFSNSSVQKTYNEFLKLDGVLRVEFIKQYKNGELTSYQMQDLLVSYKNFLYYTGKTFGYLQETEKGLRGTEINSAIESGYSNMRMSYAQVKNIVSR